MAETSEPTIAATGNGQTMPDEIPAVGVEIAEGIVELTKIKAALNEALVKVGEITNAATQALAAKTKIEDHQTVVATKSAHIEDARLHGDKVVSELDRELATAKQHAADADNHKSRAQAAADELIKVLADIKVKRDAVNADAEDVSAAMTEVEESATKTKGLADKAETVEKRLADYEHRLAELEDQGKLRFADVEGQGKALLKTIESLLPGAASTGLAYGFAERRDTFLKPIRNMEIMYVMSLALITVIAIANWFSFHEVAHTFSDTMLLWLTRLPMVAPLILLVYHAAHKQALAERLEEAYGNKVAVCSSFVGFSKQLSEVGTEVATNALAKLYDNTLATIADPPGQIYDKHKLVVTPGDVATEVAKTVKETIGQLLPGKGGPVS